MPKHNFIMCFSWLVLSPLCCKPAVVGKTAIQVKHASNVCSAKDDNKKKEKKLKITFSVKKPISSSYFHCDTVCTECIIFFSLFLFSLAFPPFFFIGPLLQSFLSHLSA